VLTDNNEEVSEWLSAANMTTVAA